MTRYSEYKVRQGNNGKFYVITRPEHSDQPWELYDTGHRSRGAAEASIRRLFFRQIGFEPTRGGTGFRRIDPGPLRRGREAVSVDNKDQPEAGEAKPDTQKPTRESLKARGFQIVEPTGKGYGLPIGGPRPTGKSDP